MTPRRDAPRPRGLPRAPVAAAFAALSSLTPRPAHADLADDVERIEARWRASTADVHRLEPRLLERGTLELVGVPEALLDPRAPGCTTVAVVGPAESAFVVRFLGEPADGRREPAEESSAGAVQIVRCATRKASLARLVIEMRSPRVVVETLAARAVGPLPAPGRMLPGRDPGPPLPMPSPGPRPDPAPLEQRLTSREAQRRTEGAVTIERRSVTSRPSGSGDALVPLEAGCHAIDLFAPPSVAGRAFDIDAELGWPMDPVTISSDRSESPDASLFACVGTRRAARLSFAGGPGRASLAALHAAWRLPGGIPGGWPRNAAARSAMALRRLHPTGPHEPPIWEAMGVAGVTLAHVPTEPGACYIAVVAGAGEGLAAFRMAAVAGTWAQAQSLDRDGAAAVAFCSGSAETARLEIDAHSTVETWIAAVWRTSRVTLGEEGQ